MNNDYSTPLSAQTPGQYVSYQTGTLVESAYNGLNPTDDAYYNHANQVESCICSTISY